MCQIEIQTSVKMFYILEICHLLGCIIHRINCIDQGQWPLNTTADFGGFSNWFFSDVLTRWMKLKGIFIFEFIYSNEIFISSNKNHHKFLQFNEVINDIFILFLVIFYTYQIIYALFSCVVLLNLWQWVVPFRYGKPLSLYILCIFVIAGVMR